MSGRPVWLFPGQGSQKSGMGRALRSRDPTFRRFFDSACDACAPHIDVDLPALIDDEAESGRLNETRYAQPALFVLEYALGETLRARDLQPAALLGHSVGEYAAATLAGVFSLEDAATLVCHRGRIMHEAPTGAMLAVALAADDLVSRLPQGTAISGYNAPGLTVVGGPEAEIAALGKRCSDDGVAAFELSTRHAFHTADMDTAVAEFLAIVRETSPAPPQLPLVASATGEVMSAEVATSADYWATQIRHPVRFLQSVDRLLADGHADFWEVGPGTALTSNVRRIPGTGSCVTLMPGDATGASLESVIGAEPPQPSTGDDAPPASSDDGQITDRVAALIGEFTGQTPTPDAYDQSFATLGLDSLMLTQVATAIRRQFGVTLKFRRLLEDLECVNVLARWIAPQVDSSFANGSAPVRPTRPKAGSVSDDGEKPFGAQAKIEREASAALDDKQRRALSAFTANYTAATARSKSFTASHRAAMADPRVVSGFNPLWKELVYPIVVDRSKGCRVWDLDDNEYIDVVSGFGSTYLGYQPQFITDAIADQMERGYELGPQHPLTADVTELIREMTGVDRVAFCNTGSEAVMGAMRCARTVTGRELIVIFTDSYHGIFDEVIVRGTPALRSIAAAPGILASAVENVLVLEYGHPKSLEVIRERGEEVAAVMVEPIQRRNPTLQPRTFLHDLRGLTEEIGAALIFDEIITGFRVAPGGAQEFFDVRADLVTYGKVIGGGLPLAAIAGRRLWMDALDGGHWQFGDDSVPEAGVTYFAGTFVRHPLALAAARAALLHLREQGPQLLADTNDRVTDFVVRINAMFTEEDVAISVDHFSTICRITIDPSERLAPMLYFYLRAHGVHIYEGFGMFLGASHQQSDLDELLARWRAAVVSMRDDGLLTWGDATQEDPTTFALTAPQREIWLACQLDRAVTAAYHETVMVRIRGDADTRLLESATDMALARHEALHVRFDPNGTQQQRRLPARTLVRVQSDPVDAAKRDEHVISVASTQRDREFDWSAEPPFRATLIRLAEDDHALVLTAHHLAYDGWSENVLMEEIAVAFRALSVDAPPQWKSPPLYSDYAATVEGAARSALGQRDRDYWSRQFAPPPEPLDLPTDRPRTSNRRFRANHLSVAFDSSTGAAINALARACRTTTYSVLLTAYAVLLSRLSRRDDLVIGIPVAGQADSDFEYLVGHCVSLLPLRLRVDADATVEDCIARVSGTLLDGREHASMSFGEILEETKIRRDPARPTLVAASFNVDPKLAPLQFNGAQTTIIHLPAVAINEELKFNVAVNSNDQFEASVAFDADLFDQDTIERWVRYFTHLLRQMASDSGAKLAALELLSGSDLDEVHAAGRGPRVPLDADTVGAMIELGLDREGERLALRWPGGSMAYRSLERRTAAIADSLNALGGRIGVCLPRSPEWACAVLAIIRSGACYVALDPVNPTQRLLRMIDAADVDAVIVNTSTASLVQNDGVVSVDIDDLFASTTQLGWRPTVSSPDDLAVVLFTSGSTGEPKAVALTHENIASRLTWEHRRRPPRDDDVLFIKSTPSFDVSVYELLRTITGTMTGYLLGEDLDADPAALVDTIGAERITIAHFTPSMLRLALEQPEVASRLASLRELHAGGERVDPDLVTAVHERLRIPLGVRYGPAEATVDVTDWVSDPTVAIDEVPLGSVDPNCDIRIVDAAGKSVPFGVTGEIVIGGAQVAQGYLGGGDSGGFRMDATDPETNRRVYFTGDLGRLTREGHVFFAGRIDDQIKLRGQRIEPAEIEAAIRGCEGVDECAAVLAGSGETATLAAFIAGTASVDQVRDVLLTRLPPHMVPSRLVAVEHLPRTASGKVDRRELSQRPFGGDEEAFSGRAPSTDMEVFVASLWHEVLGTDQFAADQDFFALGGHSLLAFRVVALARERLEIDVPLRDMFDASTIAGFATLLETRLNSALAALTDEEVELALSQESAT